MTNFARGVIGFIVANVVVFGGSAGLVYVISHPPLGEWLGGIALCLIIGTMGAGMAQKEDDDGGSPYNY